MPELTGTGVEHPIERNHHRRAGDLHDGLKGSFRRVEVVREAEFAPDITVDKSQQTMTGEVAVNRHPHGVLVDHVLQCKFKSQHVRQRWFDGTLPTGTHFERCTIEPVQPRPPHAVLVGANDAIPHRRTIGVEQKATF